MKDLPPVSLAPWHMRRVYILPFLACPNCRCRAAGVWIERGEVFLICQRKCRSNKDKTRWRALAIPPDTDPGTFIFETFGEEAVEIYEALPLFHEARTSPVVQYLQIGLAKTEYDALVTSQRTGTDD